MPGKVLRSADAGNKWKNLVSIETISCSEAATLGSVRNGVLRNFAYGLQPYLKKDSLLHNVIHQSLNSRSAQVQILLAACRRFAMVRLSDNGPGWK